MKPLELWGGIECTVNRTRSGYSDQIVLSGHHDREADLDLFAGLGLKAIRYPVLWERTAPERGGEPDWRWSDVRLQGLRDRKIRPIVGLTHHGSGPAYTSLLDEDFAPGLARYAAKVAQRYDWIRDWTPVNEPLTTARFSALYGHWYPHRQDEASFWRALINQVDGVRLAMKAIRRVTPGARLIQTDDLGRTYSTLKLAEQAMHDNVRRWAGWDLLFGNITRHHPLWSRIARAGLGERLKHIADDPCPPDVLGVNHYLTSDRFLDHRIQRYPRSTHGGNGKLSFADTEAIRVLEPAPAGLGGALLEAWQRYRVPLALTEVHNGCTREEQVRWAADAWDTATALRSQGVEIEAVTAWSLLGSHGWNTLLTKPGAYEAGVFDVANGAPRPTALARLWKGLPLDAARHPVATGSGWWKRSDRIVHRPMIRPAKVMRTDLRVGVQPLLICGATGTLGQAFACVCAMRGISCVVTSREELNLERIESVAETLDTVQPWAVVNAAGWVRVDDAEEQQDACLRANTQGALTLAQACADRDIGYLGFSSDLVFDGMLGRAYCESDRPNPLSVYGRSKVAMEQACQALPGILIIRTAAFFSSWDNHNFARDVTRVLLKREPFIAANDHIVSPTFVPDLVQASLDLLIDGAEGIWHLANAGVVSWADFAKQIAVACGLDKGLIEPVAGSSLNWRARRPPMAALTTERGGPLRPLEEAIVDFAGNAIDNHSFKRLA
jgi:dTDP-4-dehydrorhamnose reductase